MDDDGWSARVDIRSGGARSGRDVVAIVLAIGVACAVNVFAIAFVLSAIFDGGLPDGFGHLLAAFIGAMLGALGTYTGYRRRHWPSIWRHMDNGNRERPGQPNESSE